MPIICALRQLTVWCSLLDFDAILVVWQWQVMPPQNALDCSSHSPTPTRKPINDSCKSVVGSVDTAFEALSDSKSVCVVTMLFVGAYMQTRWGTSTLTVAFKLLLKEALTEPSNQRFVLLDESAVPLYPAAAIYLQLMGEAKSRVAACVVRPSLTPLPAGWLTSCRQDCACCARGRGRSCTRSVLRAPSFLPCIWPDRRCHMDLAHGIPCPRWPGPV